MPWSSAVEATSAKTNNSLSGAPSTNRWREHALLSLARGGAFCVVMSYNPRMSDANGLEEATRLVHRWQPALRAFFIRRIHDRSEAEDLTQEVLLRMLSQPPPESDSYIFQIAQNLLFDRQRRYAVRERFTRRILAEAERDRDPRDAHSIVEVQQELGLVMATLANLPERTRAIFILYRFEHMRQNVIAASFGISTSAVKQQVAKATAALVAAVGVER